jgi:hypothetical protein
MPPPADAAGTACCARQGHEIAARHRVAAIAARRFTHAALWSALEPMLRAPAPGESGAPGAPGAPPALRVREIGRSIQGRAIRAVTFGTGPTTVLLWSQMHGDESTATMSLADLMAWMTSGDPVDEPLRRRLAAGLTVVMVPMLNPDGAELFQRENALGVDVNRDARRLVTPEARALKGLRDSLRPAFGFNLHDQGARTLAGTGGRQVGIALLAPAADEARSWGPVRGAARQVAAGVATALAREIPGHMAKYNDTFEPRAFGDLMQQWGTSTVLIESGALPDDPEKQRLRALNVVAIVGALDAIATRRYLAADVQAYERLPFNRGGATDVLVRGASVVLPGASPMVVDLAINYEEPVARRGPRVRDVGDLAALVALDTIDATGLFLHPAPDMLAGGGEHPGRWLRIDAPAAFTLRRGASPTSEAVRTLGDGAATARP